MSSAQYLHKDTHTHT